MTLTNPYVKFNVLDEEVFNLLSIVKNNENFVVLPEIEFIKLNSISTVNVKR